jgi:hypothetical protein
MSSIGASPARLRIVVRTTGPQSSPSHSQKGAEKRSSAGKGTHLAGTGRDGLSNGDLTVNAVTW